MTKNISLILSLGALQVFTACAAIKPYEKEHLLDPMMDDAAVRTIRPDHPLRVANSYEHLSSQGAGGAAVSSCPTCGG